MQERKEINLRVGANIQRARERAGLTQDKLSELIGVTPNHISAIERGVYGVSLETMEKLCAVLEVSADFLLFGNAPDAEARLLVERLAKIPARHKRQVLDGIAALLALAEQN